MKNQLINKVSESLKQIHSEYSSRGLLSIFIWGSILTDDFNPEKSDVDTVAIVDDKLTLSSESEIRNKLAAKNPEIKKVGFRLLYKSELNTGVIVGNLSSFIDPRLLLLDLPTWKWICGVIFEQKDFQLPVPSYIEAIEMIHKSLRRNSWTNIYNIKPRDVQYFIKTVLRIIHLQQLSRNGSPYTLFSYSTINDLANNEKEKCLVDACLNVKKSGWSLDELKKKSDLFKTYLAHI